ncbi:hypothetical protein D3C80_1025170 [compost metagenome]
MVKVFPTVQLEVLLALKFIVWVPVPKAIVELFDRVNVPTVSVNPVVFPVLSVPPLNSIFEVFVILSAASSFKIPDFISVVPV